MVCSCRAVVRWKQHVFSEESHVVFFHIKKKTCAGWKAVRLSFILQTITFIPDYFTAFHLFITQWSWNQAADVLAGSRRWVNVFIWQLHHLLIMQHDNTCGTGCCISSLPPNKICSVWVAAGVKQKHLGISNFKVQNRSYRSAAHIRESRITNSWYDRITNIDHHQKKTKKHTLTHTHTTHTPWGWLGYGWKRLIF